MTTEAFMRGLKEGLLSPASMLNPGRVSTYIDPSVLKRSYRPASEDVRHIRGYFQTALTRANKEISPNKKNSGR